MGITRYCILSFLLIFALGTSTNAYAISLKWMTWIGFKEPTADSWHQISDCYRIGLQNSSGDQEEIEILITAAQLVCATMKTEAFKQEIRLVQWRTACGKNKEITRDLLIERLATKVSDFSIYIKKPRGATGQAWKAKNRIAIAPIKIRKWKAGLRKPLLNTLSHEITHLISSDFKDKGHKKTACKTPKLVSYGIGKIVSEMAYQM